MQEFNWNASRELIAPVWVPGSNSLALRRPETIIDSGIHISDEALQCI